MSPEARQFLALIQSEVKRALQHCVRPDDYPMAMDYLKRRFKEAA